MPSRSGPEFSRHGLARRPLRRLMPRFAEPHGSEHPTHLSDEHAWQARLAEKSVTDRFHGALPLRVQQRGGQHDEIGIVVASGCRRTCSMKSSP